MEDKLLHPSTFTERRNGVDITIICCGHLPEPEAYRATGSTTFHVSENVELMFCPTCQAKFLRYTIQEAAKAGNSKAVTHATALLNSMGAGTGG